MMMVDLKAMVVYLAIIHARDSDMNSRLVLTMFDFCAVVEKNPHIISV